MTITKDQAQMIATLATACRPTGARQWNPDAVMAEIAKLRGRNLGAVICAVTRAAMDRNAERPEVIGSNGSHWSDTVIAADWVPSTAPPGTRCTVCGDPEDRHRATDHAHRLPRPKDPDDYVAHVAELRATLEPTAGPTERRTLDDLAAANPKLHERVQAVRDALPGVAAPPMQEDEPIREETAVSEEAS